MAKGNHNCAGELNKNQKVQETYATTTQKMKNSKSAFKSGFQVAQFI